MVNTESRLVTRALRALRQSPDTRALKRELRAKNHYALALLHARDLDYVDGAIVSGLRETEPCPGGCGTRVEILYEHERGNTPLCGDCFERLTVPR
jgi:hypothetical protein